MGEFPGIDCVICSTEATMFRSALYVAGVYSVVFWLLFWTE
jgi:hypothetical protein